MNRDERIVVVGGGLTGLRAAERLRELKFEGDITILGDEKLPPYHRPALSKQLLQGSLRPSDLTLPAYEDLNARWRFGTQVRQLIPNKKTLVLPGGEEMTYDGLIIATGVEATRQNGVPYHDPRVLVLRTMSDGLDLERVIGSTKGRVAVIGGGFTGCELAASLRHLSREVTLIGRGKNLLGNVLGPDLGEWLTNMHRDHGVDLALGNSVEEWAPGTDGIGLKLTDGSRLTVSCVILAAGTKPMTHWLRGSGLPLDNGVVCEPTCHVVGADDVVAAGDVAQWPNLRFDNVPRRVEHWLNAVEMGRAAAESLMAGRENAEPFCPMPRFWTDQYSARIQAAGMLKLGKDIVKLGTPDEGTGTVYGFSSEGRLMGVVGVDCPSAMIAWGESVSRQNPEPRPRVPAEQQAAAAKAPITVGGLSSKKPKGKHLAPPREKQFQQSAENPGPEIGFVEHPAEVSGPVGVGPGVAPNGVPTNVVDSYSRMLPVAVRPPHVSGPLPVNGRPTPPPGGRTMPSGPLPLHPSGPLPVPPPNNGSTSGAFPTGTRQPVNGFAGGPTGSGIGAPAPASSAPTNSRPNTNGTRRNVMRVNGVPSSGFGIGRNATNGSASRSRNGVPPVPFGTQNNNRPALGPGTGQSQHVTPPAFSAAEMTDVGGLPEPLSGRLGPNAGLPIDVTGQMALLDANGHVRTPEFSDTPARRGPSDSVGGMPPVRGPEASFGGMPPARGPESSFTNMPAARDPELSVGGMPPARRPAARGPQDSHRALPPARGPEASFGGMPPVRRGPQDSFTGLPPARRGPEDSFENMPPVRRGAQDSFTALPPARRGPEDSFDSMPPARRGAQDSFSALPPASAPPTRRGTQDSFSALPRRGAQDSFSALLPASVRDGETSVDGIPAVSRLARGPEDSFSALPPARHGTESETSVDGMPPVRRGAQDSYSALPPARTSGRRRAPEADSYTTMPQANRHAAHRAEDLTPEFGRPPKRRRDAGSDNGGARMVPAMSSMDDSIEMPAVRMPKHGRPEDYGVPSARGGPEDSYDYIPAVERPRPAGGRRRARA